MVTAYKDLNKLQTDTIPACGGGGDESAKVAQELLAFESCQERES